MASLHGTKTIGSCSCCKVAERYEFPQSTYDAIASKGPCNLKVFAGIPALYLEIAVLILSKVGIAGDVALTRSARRATLLTISTIEGFITIEATDWAPDRKESETGAVCAIES